MIWLRNDYLPLAPQTLRKTSKVKTAYEFHNERWPQHLLLRTLPNLLPWKINNFLRQLQTELQTKTLHLNSVQKEKSLTGRTIALTSFEYWSDVTTSILLGLNTGWRNWAPHRFVKIAEYWVCSWCETEYEPISRPTLPITSVLLLLKCKCAFCLFFNKRLLRWSVVTKVLYLVD